MSLRAAHGRPLQALTPWLWISPGQFDHGLHADQQFHTLSKYTCMHAFAITCHLCCSAQMREMDVYCRISMQTCPLFFALHVLCVRLAEHRVPWHHTMFLQGTHKHTNFALVSRHCCRVLLWCTWLQLRKQTIRACLYHQNKIIQANICGSSHSGSCICHSADGDSLSTARKSAPLLASSSMAFLCL
jgi:hypothetical protein